MELDLTELSGISGVTDVFVYSRGGELVTPQLKYRDERIEGIGYEVALCAAILERLTQGVDYFEFIYEDRHMIIQLADNFLIAVICDETADATLIKLSMKVLSSEAKGDKDLQKVLRKLGGQREVLLKAQGESTIKELYQTLKISF